LLYQVKQNLETDLALLLSKQELEQTNIQLKESNNTKDKFFSIIAHDLRSTFNGLLGLTKLLEDEQPTMTQEQT